MTNHTDFLAILLLFWLAVFTVVMIQLRRHPMETGPYRKITPLLIVVAWVSVIVVLIWG